jgi:hypothetical protein
MKNILGFSHKPTVQESARRYAFIFICQQGELEIKASLLAASLKRNLRCRSELIACIPDPEKYGRPSLETLSFLKSLDVRLVETVNPLGAEHVHANKIPCFAVPTTANKMIYVDSDFLCLEPFADESRFFAPINVKPVDLQTYTRSIDVWRRTYRAALLDMPDRTVRSTVSLEDGPPHFNGGFIAVNSGPDLAAAWLYCARHLQADATLPANGSQWNDQPSLAVAIHLMNVVYDLLDERYNFPAHLRPLGNNKPFFCHYHWPNVIRREPRLNRLVQDLASAHDDLARILERDPAWAMLLEPYAVRPRPSRWCRPPSRPFEGPDLLVTGIQGSGMDELASHLRAFSNVIVDDEPAAVGAYLRDEVVPTHVATHFRDVRRDVLEGKGGASVDAADFAVAVKHAGFLDRLDVLARDAVPGVRIVACVRNPVDAIAAWTRGGEPAAAAAEWCRQAGIVLRNSNRITIVRYDELASNPTAVLERLCAGMKPGAPRESIRPSAQHTHADAFDAKQRAAILSACSESARALGVLPV